MVRQPAKWGTLHIMDLFNIAVLGLIQGITEFLPVSSTGHLSLARILFGIQDAAGTATDAFLHLGTLLAVLAYYWQVWWGILRGMFVRDAEGNDKRQLFGKIMAATLPGALAGYLFVDYFDGMSQNTALLAFGFALNAAALLFAEWVSSRHAMVMRRAGWREAFVIGIAQVLALAPSISRSGMTIAAGQAQGLSRSQAVHFSFLMSAPIIAGAGLGTLPLLLQSQAHSPAALVGGFFVAFLSGLGAIHLLVRLTRYISFVPFALYMLVLAGLIVVLL